MRAICQAHVIVLHLILVLIFGEEYKLCCSLCRSHHLTVTPSFSGLGIPLNTLFPSILNQPLT
jgi:hypothetical protein